MGPAGRAGAAHGHLRERIGGSEEIHGWLTVDETAELALHLDELPLPRYEPSFERMNALERQLPPLRDEAAGPPYSRDQLRLSFLRTTAFIAVDQEKGILWGNDVSSEVAQKYAASYERVRARSAGE